MRYIETLIKAADTDCAVTGLTSPWALADGGLVFCEDGKTPIAIPLKTNGVAARLRRAAFVWL